MNFLHNLGSHGEPVG